MVATTAFEWAAVASVSRHANRQPDPRPAAMVGLVKSVWLLLYSEGGLWTADEMSRRLQFGVKHRYCLTEMVARGFIVRSEVTDIDGRRSVRYGVKRGCKIPRGMGIEEIEQVLRPAAQGKPTPAAGLPEPATGTMRSS